MGFSPSENLLHYLLLVEGRIMGGRRDKRASRSRLRGRDGAYVNEAGHGHGGVEIVIDNGGNRKRRLCCCMPKIGCLIAFLCIQIAFMITAAIILIIYRTRDRRISLGKYCAAGFCFFDVLCDVLAIIALARRRHRWLLFPWFGLNCLYFVLFCLSLLCPLFLWWRAMLRRMYRCIKTDFGYRHVRETRISISGRMAASGSVESMPTLVQYPPTMPHAFVPSYMPGFMNMHQQPNYMIPMQQMPAHQMYHAQAVGVHAGPMAASGPPLPSAAGFAEPSISRPRPPQPPPPYSEHESSKFD